MLGCQSDSATRCIGTVTLSVRGGRRLYRKRFNLRPGAGLGYGRAISVRTERALEARGLRMTIRTETPSGGLRIRSRVFDIDPLADEDGN